MHADQVDVSVAVVARLVAEQFPQWGGLQVRPVVTTGTVNVLFRLGDEFVLRFSLRPSLDAAMRAALITEQDNARRMAVHVPVAVPEPVALGEPGAGYAGLWAAYRWIPGEPASPHNIGNGLVLAKDLAEFVRAMQAMDTGDRSWDGLSRGGPLSASDDDVRRALGASTGLTDTVGLARAWARCMEAPRPDAGDVWLHADLMPGNLLVRDGRLSAVIDLEAVCVGDPAVDLMPAWNLLPAQARETYRRALGVDDATWERGRGWAIMQGIVALPYYVHTNPAMAETARRTLDAVLD